MDIFYFNQPSARFYTSTAKPVSGGSGVGIQFGSAGLIGNGSPEGVVIAVPGTTYYDQAGNSYWVKGPVIGKTGWNQLIGNY
jgi:hypothetical protein